MNVKAFPASCFVAHQSLNFPIQLQVVGSPSMVAQPQVHQGQSFPVSQQQRVTIQNKYGEKLVGVLHETGSTELVILCHGLRCSKDHQIFKNLAAALEKEGISAFRFDFTGNGESEGSFEFGNYHREAEDLHAVVLHFAGAKRLISAILGHSKDEVIPVEDALEFAKVIPNHKLHIVEGANHNYSAHQADLTSIVLEFIRAAIQQDKDMSKSK